MYKLSILVPTYNRCKYLERTLEALLPQIERHLEEVELVVCSNASTDGTDKYIKSLMREKSYISYHYFNDFVEICLSFSRSIDYTSGEYIIIWGDDDIAFPYAVDFILDSLYKNEGIGLLHYNVISGKDLKYGMKLFRFERAEWNKTLYRMSLEEFLQEHTLSSGFVTSLCFKKEAWIKGRIVDTHLHYGYEFLGIIYWGVHGLDCAYSDFPLIIQRMPFQRAWLDKWALYALIGVPQLYRDLEKWGLCKHAFQVWNRKENSSLKEYLKSLLNASAYKKKYLPLCKNIASFQSSYIRKFFAYIIIYTFPPFVYRISRKLTFKRMR